MTAVDVALVRAAAARARHITRDCDTSTRAAVGQLADAVTVLADAVTVLADALDEARRQHDRDTDAA